ncbi:hypothetical protein LEP1GSC042_2856 [Leptospira kirschneri serovar Bim str. PUO 1247]|nr:hypothetical protein LEP1GSC042_2856 [Leptospira kirschneri serovar Bim str. PUO 1247]
MKSFFKTLKIEKALCISPVEFREKKFCITMSVFPDELHFMFFSRSPDTYLMCFAQ